MGPIVERLVIFMISKVLTPEVIKGAEAEFVVFLRVLAKKSPNLIDDALVELVAEALGVQ